MTVRYFQGIAAQVVRPSSPRNPPFAGVEVDRRETAERPGGQVTRVRSGRVTITAVDAVAGTVSFVGPDGFQRTVTTTNLQLRAFMLGLRVGERVDMVYEEALAVSVEPMRS